MIASTQNKIFQKRIVWMTVFLFFGFGVILLRLFTLQIISADTYKALAEDQYTLAKKLKPDRGEIKIVDKFSTVPYTVATNIDKDLLYAIPQSIANPKQTADLLAPVLRMTPEEILSKISDTSKKYAPIKKQLSDEEETKIKDLHLQGLAFDTETLRFYPEKNFLSQVLGFIGFTDKDNQIKSGLYGLEKFYDDKLKGQLGFISQEKDAGGAWIFGAKRQLKPAVNGDNLVLTIDKSIQFKAETVLAKAVIDNVADSGSIIVMDAKTGAILAMANSPSFDPNEFNKQNDPAVYSNLATTGNYEPGSVFKAITMAAAVDEGKVGPDTTYNDTGQVVVDGYTIKNSDGKAHGIQTMIQVLDESLNTGAIFAKEQIGNKDFAKYVRKFGFGKPTGIELSEAKGDTKSLDGNVAVNFDTMSFGQGISVTPIQLVQAYDVLANGGKMMKPYLVQSIVTPDGKVISTNPQSVDQVISGKTASVLSAMLVDVVEQGHGKKASVPGYYVAGKTGTAQVPRKDGKGYDTNNNIGSFIGYAPVESPKFVMLVRINHPRTVKFAESTAAPAFGEMAKFILNYFNIAPTRPISAKK